jgi:PAS domain S-box-containing protein
VADVLIVSADGGKLATLIRELDDRIADLDVSVAAGTDAGEVDESTECLVFDSGSADSAPGRLLGEVRSAYPTLPFVLLVPPEGAASIEEVLVADRTTVLRRRGDATDAAMLANRVQTLVESDRRERKLERERERFDTLFEVLTQPVVEVEFRDGVPIVLRVNRAFEEVFGYEEATMVGRSLDEFVVPPERQEEAVSINSRVQDGEMFAVEVTRQTADGEREFLLQNAVYPDSDVEFAMYTDITERKERERELQRQNDRLQALFRNARSAVVEYVYYDDEAIVERVNSRFESVFGYEGETLVGEPLDRFIVPSDERGSISDIDERVKRGEHLDEEVRRETVDGVQTFILRNTPIDTGDRVRGYASYVDITQRKERERELERTKRRLEDSNEALRRKNERLEQFASVVSHDLRNPLTVARLQAEFAEESGGDEHFERLHTSHERMDAMIEDLLLLARAETSVDTDGTVALASRAKRAWEGVRTPGSKLELDLSGASEIRGDPELLGHVFENLFRNAVDHNDRPVTVRVGVLAENGERTGFYVEDDGCGIDPDSAGQATDYGYSTAESGTGFGLSIVAEFVDRHGWELTIGDSTDGGARFEIRWQGPEGTGTNSGV